jgi:hypothetical protein
MDPSGKVGEELVGPMGADPDGRDRAAPRGRKVVESRRRPHRPSGSRRPFGRRRRGVRSEDGLLIFHL